MRILVQAVSVLALVFTFGCGGSDGGSEPASASDCRTEGNGCIGNSSCQLNADDAYECLPSNQGGNEAGAAGSGGNEAGAAGSGGNEAGAAGSGGNEAGAAGQGGDSDNEAGAAGSGGMANACEGQADGCPDLDFAPIEGDVFQMDSNHQVTIPSFEMMRTEVTVAQYRVCVDAGVCTVPGGDYDASPGNRENQPVRYVTWFQAKIFAEFVDARLPSEAEWEYAARSGGQDITYPWGNDAPDCSRLNFDNCVGTTTPVCTYPTGNTTQGLCDMAGNVFEWTEDDWHSNYTGAPADGSPWIDDPRGQLRVFRGGSYFNYAVGVRAANRVSNVPSFVLDDLGFRLARSAR
jgi:hypothetical protein